MKNKLKHLAVVLDGNRRYARARGMPSWKGHEAGAEKVEKLMKWCQELEIKELTLYILSAENLKRTATELNFLFNLFVKWFKKFKEDKRIRKNKVKIKFIGNLSLVPKHIAELAREIEKETENYDKYKINICFAYGGRQELLEIINKLKKKKGRIKERDVEKALWLTSEPELIIRTGNRFRTSNFLPWQSIYSEWLFVKKMWPEFSKQDLKKAVKEFESRQRNFGR
jgi:tritrans,polycis-undecaprenyl-diphosphate synthase [geranylgeranyl-diphosphate specific]